MPLDPQAQTVVDTIAALNLKPISQSTPDEAREAIRRYAEAGVERLMLQDLLPWDLDMVDLMGRELLGRA